MSNLLCEAKGVNGQLYVYGDKIVISRKGFLGTLGHGFAGNKEILISQISSVQYKNAGAVNGFIQFAFLGGTEAKGGVFNAAQDENAIVFNIWQRGSFETAKKIIDERLNMAHSVHSQTSTTIQSNDIPTQIKKLAELKEAGILSEEEFNSKKAELLARM